MKNIKDWNRSEVLGNTVFHFQNSLRPFINVSTQSGEEIFIDIDEMVAYTLDELDFEGLYFYGKEDDEDFKGVEIDGILKWDD